MGKSKKASGIVMFLMFASAVVTAQSSFSKWQYGIAGGVFVYQGDLSPSGAGAYKTIKPTVNLYLSRILTPSFILRTNLALGKLRGDESRYSTPAYHQQRNLSFTTPVTEVSELLVWNMFGNNNNEIGNRFSPYLFGGIGINFLNVNRTNNLNKVFFASEPEVEINLAADLRRATPNAIMVLPVGAGVEYFISPKISLTAETNFRYTFTDYLDGYSIVANPKKKDFYQSHTVGIVFKPGKKNQTDCPKFKY